MQFTPKIQKAINVASLAHQNQKRVGLDLPYIVHPFAVMLIIAEFRDNEDLLCAALLHDIVEDNLEYTREIVSSEFGESVATIVDYVTETRTVDTNGQFMESWDERKAKYLARLSEASENAVILSAGDSIQNLNSLVETYRKCGPEIWKSFGASINKKLNYYRQVEQIVQKRTDCKIKNALKESLSRLEAILKSNSFSNQSILLSQSSVNSV